MPIFILSDSFYFEIGSRYFSSTYYLLQSIACCASFHLIYIHKLLYSFLSYLVLFAGYPLSLYQCSAHARYPDGRQWKMASSMNGMFQGQQPPGAHPVGGPPGPAQPSFSGTAPRVQGNNTLVDELEASFEVGGQRATLALLLALAVVANTHTHL